MTGLRSLQRWCAGVSAGLLVAWVSAVPGEAAPPRELVVVRGPLPVGAAATLTRAMAYHGESGGFALGQATAGEVAKLRQLGFDVVALGAWPEGRQLVVARTDHAPDGERLFATAQAVLVALPEGDATIPPTGCHAQTLVSPTAWKPAPPFSGTQAVVAADPRVAALVAQVSQANVQATTTQLASYFTRRANSAQVLVAKDWLVAQLQAIPGLTVTTSTFNAAYGPNVIATKTGSVHPERVIVLGAHYDSVNGDGATLAAPGADDNASGSAGLLETARLLAQGDYENTVRCVWYCAEELGLIGSTADAQALDAAGTQVIAMLNLDMISYRKAGDPHDLDFVTSNTDPVLTQFCRDITAAYVPTLPTLTGPLGAGSSDHASYAATGVPTAFYFEDLSDETPFIHTAGDTVGPSANDFVLARDITRSFAAAAATLAGPVDLALAHVPLADTSDAGGPYPLAVAATSLTASPVASVTAFYRVGAGPEQPVELMASTTPGLWVGSLPGIQAAGASSGDVHYRLLASDGAGHQQWLPEGWQPESKSYQFTVGTLVAAFSDGFEGPGDNGWTHAQVLTQDDWQRGAPVGQSGDPSGAAQGAAVWANDLGSTGWNGAYGSSVENWLESPAINTLGKTGLHLRFKRWLSVEDGTFDQASIAINGSTVWQNPSTPGGVAHTLDSEWTQQDLDVSALADNKPSVRVRFKLKSDGGLEFGGWTVDDLKLASVQPGTVPRLTASVAHVSATAGGTVSFAIDAGPAFAGRTYLVALSATGTAPGTPLGSVLVPLVFDSATQLGLGFINTPAFQSFAAPLSAQGKGTASFHSPPLVNAALPGLDLHFAAFTLGPIDWASNAVTVQYEP
ncbi:MAG TPA: M28 family peptidase [Planctomycetota bacterium]|nr:M28 family peptidase [Planctomycetota bacterium]